MILDDLKVFLEGHRKTAGLNCDATCFCWEVENFIDVHGRDAELHVHPTTEQGGACGCFNEWDSDRIGEHCLGCDQEIRPAQTRSGGG